MMAVEAPRTGCPRCGSDAVEIRVVKSGSPHAAGEYCGVCGRWRRWISKREAASLRGNGGEA
jgi:transcription elongation factor Elf1